MLRGEGVEVVFEDEAMEAGTKETGARRPAEALHRGLGIPGKPSLRRYQYDIESKECATSVKLRPN